MPAPLIAVCGLDCTTCGAWQATQAHDLAAKEAVLAQWRDMYHADIHSIEAVTCDGCQADSGRHGFHCAECEFRACAVEKNLATCAECPQYACEKLHFFFKFVPAAKANLDGLRK